MSKCFSRLLFVAIIISISPGLFGQSRNDDIDLNEKYKYPLAVGFEYKSMNPSPQLGTDYGGEFLTTDLSATVSLPMAFHTLFQPFARIGLINLSFIENPEIELDNTEFNNFQLYASLGAAYRYMFSKQFEIGGTLGFGLSQIYYNDFMGDGEAYGQLDFLMDLGAEVGMNLSYNIHLSLNPVVRMRTHMGPTVERFDGFSVGVGIGGSYRFGVDPDAPQAEIRSIKAGLPDFPPVFAPMQSYYSKNPLTTISIRNIEKIKITDINVSFFQAGFMDTPTNAADIAEIPAGEDVEIDIPAIYNQQIFTTEGITPLTGEIIIEYINNGRVATQKFPVSYDLYDKESLTWDDDNKVAAFITPSDSALRNYSSYVRQICKDYTEPGFSPELQTAIQIFYALGEFGVLYQRDPTSPFEAAQENPMIVDSISLPRNTLTRSTGDCDDLTVLFCSLLEAVGIETAFITVPGHIYAAFRTSTPSKSYKLLHPDKNMTINIDGELWVPVEITLIGEADFGTAWRTGIEEFAAYEDKPELRAVNRTHKAQEIYRPVVLTEKDLGLQYGDRTKIVKDFKNELDKTIAAIIADYELTARDNGSKGSYNRLGIASAQLGQYSKAEQAFNSALSMDRNYLPPKINLGNVYFMKGEYQNALRLLHGAEKSIIDAEKHGSSSYSSVLLSISKCYYELENFDKANEYMTTLAEVDPDSAAQNAYLASGEPGARASDRSSRNSLVFAED